MLIVSTQLYANLTLHLKENNYKIIKDKKDKEIWELLNNESNISNEDIDPEAEVESQEKLS